ncbi:hypothetical protein LSTR_LSTR008610 [Laodelphax striatellus]|uniref:Uncharacterized protein n=1 Tax=Laodelphax striatellus TaxID=195883 RepID=A0A482X110_LAOST|nr:hypothetical protein LSTR_LSTR008610 [Laodelphax striatellus]
MPKIFLIKNRLHLQQLKLLETQKNRDESVSLSPPGSPLNEPQPLSLIVNKSVRNSSDDEERGARGERCGGEGGPQAPRRFISSILGGDVPYAGSHHILTSAEKKEYVLPKPASPSPPPKAVVPVPDKQLSPSCDLSEREQRERDNKRETPPAGAPRCQPVSVIQRTPAAPLLPPAPLVLPPSAQAPPRAAPSPPPLLAVSRRLLVQ